MRNAVIAVGLFLCSFIVLSNQNIHAFGLEVAHLATVQERAGSDDSPSGDIRVVLGSILPTTDEDESESTPVKETPPQVHTVARGETLTSIARRYELSWKQLYNKNTAIAHPDKITVGMKITIPAAGEKLLDRQVPVTQQRSISSSPARAAQPTSAPVAQVSSSYTTPRGNTSGNTYYAGYCTWYAKSRRPDLPNNLGNAITWVSRAAAQGYATGSAPRVGAIGQQGNHVVYVERVHANGTVTISEMNYEGFGVVSSRTVPASTFRYIY